MYIPNFKLLTGFQRDFSADLTLSIAIKEDFVLKKTWKFELICPGYCIEVVRERERVREKKESLDKGREGEKEREYGEVR